MERGYLPFVVIRPENDASRGLYTKLGFVKEFETVRAVFKKPNIQYIIEELEKSDKDEIKMNGDHVKDKEE